MKNRLVVQYWYAYFYNDFWNVHEMDWEVVMIILKVEGETARPTAGAYSAHMGGHWLPWPKVEKHQEHHPVVYIANGSHANYFYGSSIYKTAPPLAELAAGRLNKSRPLVDYTTSIEKGDALLVAAQQIPEPQNDKWTGDWRWLNQKGRWGSSGKLLDLEFGDDGPYGPPRTGDKWDHPIQWIDSSCTRAPSGEKVLLPSRIEP